MKNKKVIDAHYHKEVLEIQIPMFERPYENQQLIDAAQKGYRVVKAYTNWKIKKDIYVMEKQDGEM